jgi:hypothetical protein
MPNDHQYDRIQESKALWKLAAYIFGIVAISVLLLAINSGMVFGLAAAVGARFRSVPFIESMMQYAIYVVPVLFLFLEWYVWDILISMRRRR